MGREHDPRHLQTVPQGAREGGVKERPILFSGEMVRTILDGRKTVTRRVVKGLRVRARHRVTADWTGIMDPNGELVCEAGKVYAGHIAEAGAVSAVMPNGKHLGLKPGEFDFTCPYADGTTLLAVEGGVQTWRVIPRDSRLWVRETWGTVLMHELGQHIFGDGPIADREQVTYRAGRLVYSSEDRPDGPLDFSKWPTRWVDDRTPDRWRPSIHMPRWAPRITLEVLDVRVERLQEITSADAIREGVRPHANTQTIDCETRDPRDDFRDLWDSINAKRGHPWESNPWVWRIEFETTDTP